MKPKKILVLNGPNFDVLGTREPKIYGTETLGSLEYEVQRYGAELGIDVKCYQTNSEGKLIKKIHNAVGKFDGIVYNPGAHAHYSYALRDAIAAIDVPVVEVHISDISNRESFRSVSVIEPVCVAQVMGMGFQGYNRAIDILCGAEYNKDKKSAQNNKNCSRTHDSRTQDKSDTQELFGSEALSKSQTQKIILPDIPFVDASRVSIDRQNALRQMNAQLGLIGLLVRDTSNIQWLTALEDVFDEEHAHALLVSEGGAWLHTDSRYSNALRTAALAARSTLMIDDEFKQHSKFAYDILTQAGASPLAGKVGIEDSITYAEFVKMVESFGTDYLAPTTDLVLTLRSVKDENEIARLKASQVIVDAAFAHILDFIQPGKTEREVQLELEEYMIHHGAEGLAFGSIVATGANAANPHSISGDTRLEAGQCVVLDFGARVHGYCSDMTRTVFLGEPDGVMIDAWETVRRTNEAVEAALRPGMTGMEAHQLAEGVLAEGGFGGKMGHALGHGVGIDAHELPVLNPRSEIPLVAGNVVTVEPGIYLPGQFGMRLEDFGVITDSGFDVFTQSTHDTIVI